MFAMQSVSVKRALVAVVAALTMASGMSARATIDVSQSPLFLPSPVDPNILFVLDDSGSMYWESIPDSAVLFMFPRPNGVYGNAIEYFNQVASVNYASGNANEAVSALAFRSSSYNPLYYNPAITYRPWANADG